MPLRVSIITATFNSASTIADTMQSVGEQDYPLIDHIIVDGASTDNTLQIIKEFAHHIYVISEKDEGIYDAMNKGIRAAKGDIIGILNSDDIYMGPDVISTIADVFRDPAVQCCYADLQYVDYRNTKRIKRVWKSGDYKTKSFHWGWMPPHPTFFVRKSVYDQLGLFNTQLHSAADYEMMLRSWQIISIKSVYIPQIIVKMRTGGVSNASVSNSLRANREDREAWRINGLKPYFFTLYLKPLAKDYTISKEIIYVESALITGVTGQDGAYLSELLEKGYEVHGIKRRSSLFNTDRMDHLYQDPHEKNVHFHLHYGDLTDCTNLIRIIQEIQPDEIYNLGAMSHVQVSFETPGIYRQCRWHRYAAFSGSRQIAGPQKKQRFTRPPLPNYMDWCRTFRNPKQHLSIRGHLMRLQIICVLDHRELPRSLRHVCGKWNFVQS